MGRLPARALRSLPFFPFRVVRRNGFDEGFLQGPCGDRHTPHREERGRQSPKHKRFAGQNTLGGGKGERYSFAYFAWWSG